nr:fatty acid desaturase 4.2 [Perilla frutescens]
MAEGKKNPNSDFSSSQHNRDERCYKATWTHRAWFACGCATVLIALAKSALILAAAPPLTPFTWIQLLLAALLGYVLADLGSGIYHWAIDNYGGAQTPVFGPQIESFLDHHQHPVEITKCETAGILYTVAEVVTTAVTPINILSGDPIFLAFVAVFAGCGMFSLKFHAWAHTPRSKLPPLVAALQDAGVLLRWSEHTKHHRPPYNSDFCTVSGIWNRVLDESNILAAVEAALFRATGVRPRSWSESDPKLGACADVAQNSNE